MILHGIEVRLTWGAYIFEHVLRVKPPSPPLSANVIYERPISNEVMSRVGAPKKKNQGKPATILGWTDFVEFRILQEQ